MEEDNKDAHTAAQQQIEKLMKLKLEKDKKEKMRAESSGTFNTTAEISEKIENKKYDAATCIPVHEEKPVRVKKTANSIKVEKRLYDKIHKIVTAINASGGGKITKSRFVNDVMKEFLALGIDYNVVKDRAELKKMFERLKTGN